MIEIISEIGFCFGVRKAISLMDEKAKCGYHLFLTHPLMHNEAEVKKIMDRTKFKYIDETSEIPSSENAIVFSAHGHDPFEEEKYKSFNCFDATCPLILSRYEILKKLPKETIKVFIGKKDHQETIGFLTHFRDFRFIDSSLDLETQIMDFDSMHDYFIVPQTTISQKIFGEFCFLMKKNNHVFKSLPLCENYLKRLKDSVAFLENKDLSQSVILVIGDKKSSNANEIKNGIQYAYPNASIEIGMKVKDFPFDFGKLKNVYITSATSCSTDSVNDVTEELSKRFKNLL